MDDRRGGRKEHFIVKHLNIAIDGPAGAGKSTAAKAVAKELGIHYLDTGAMYRALGLCLLRNGIDPRDKAAVERMVPAADIRVGYDDEGKQHVFLGQEDITTEIRTPEVSMAASSASAFPVARDTLSALQRKVADRYDIVMDGRDITTNVLPDSKHKFFVTASPEVRARRRLLELEANGVAADYDTVLAEIIKRDEQDTGRDYMPLRIAEDAVVIDTSDLTTDEVVRTIIQTVRGKEHF